MMDYDPKRWHDISFKHGYIYLMKKDEVHTINALHHIHGRIIDRRFYTSMSQRGDKWCWGWIAFEKPLHIFDAMIAGLVPIFREGRGYN